MTSVKKIESINTKYGFLTRRATKMCSCKKACAVETKNKCNSQDDLFTQSCKKLLSYSKNGRFIYELIVEMQP